MAAKTLIAELIALTAVMMMNALIGGLAAPSQRGSCSRPRILGAEAMESPGVAKERRGV